LRHLLLRVAAQVRAVQPVEVASDAADAARRALALYAAAS
jgi:hypothetical protein